MTTKKPKPAERLPRPAEELEALAEYYSTHDTGQEMDGGEWVEPQPMVTTSLRLPAALVDRFKADARRHGVRYTTWMRRLLEAHVADAAAATDPEVIARLERIERLLRSEHDRKAS